MKNLFAPITFILLLVGCDGVTGPDRKAPDTSIHPAYVSRAFICFYENGKIDLFAE